MPVDIILAVAG